MTAGILQNGPKSSPIMLAASWVKVPLGPKKEIKAIIITSKKKKKDI
jgi:hypothetical protein